MSYSNACLKRLGCDMWPGHDGPCRVPSAPSRQPDPRDAEIAALRSRADSAEATAKELAKAVRAAEDYRICQRADPQTEFERVNRDVWANEARMALDRALAALSEPARRAVKEASDA